MVDSRESITAKLCAFVRAWHAVSTRDKIFYDELAFDIMGRDEYKALYDFVSRGFSEQNAPFSREDTEQIIMEYIAPIPLSRIHFSESRLEQFAAEHGKIQYVICGAGADTFSFRNPNSDIEVFEIDHPDTQRYKKERIADLEWNIPKNVHFVPVDFECECMTEKLLDAGFARVECINPPDLSAEEAMKPERAKENISATTAEIISGYSGLAPH